MCVCVHICAHPCVNKRQYLCKTQTTQSLYYNRAHVSGLTTFAVSSAYSLSLSPSLPLFFGVKTSHATVDYVPGSRSWHLEKESKSFWAGAQTQVSRERRVGLANRKSDWPGALQPYSEASEAGVPGNHFRTAQSAVGRGHSRDRVKSSFLSYVL